MGAGRTVADIDICYVAFQTSIASRFCLIFFCVKTSACVIGIDFGLLCCSGVAKGGIEPHVPS